MPESDIAYIETGDAAEVTLDAYTSDVIFEAKVVGVDPGETVVDGVATYKVTLQFVAEDERVKSGMTANIDITTDKRTGVVTIPARAVITKNAHKVVRILPPPSPQQKNPEPIEVQVETGLSGGDGTVEIIKGVNVGDRVVIFEKEK